jgi:regulator of sigma E protease
MRIFTAMDMSYQFTNDEDGTYDITVKRNGERVLLKDVQLKVEDNTVHYDFWVYPGEITVGSVTVQAFKQTATDARLIYISLIDMVRGKYSVKDMSGPVGIVDSIGSVIESETDADTGKINWSELADSMLTLAAFITINVGIFNLLPLPALDGGRLIFLIIEAIRRKPVKPEHEGMVHAIGMALLLILMIVITVSDVIKLV